MCNSSLNLKEGGWKVFGLDKTWFSEVDLVSVGSEDIILLVCLIKHQ
jgi:hypothetical protein